MLKSLTVTCRQCAKECPSHEWVAGLCLDCRALNACAADRAELKRLWQKRLRYMARGISVKSLNRQALGVQARSERRIRDLVSNPQRALDLIERNAQLAAAAATQPERVLLPGGRSLLDPARQGQVLELAAQAATTP